MKPKEFFLRTILDQIAVLQKAYETNKNLPDSVFESFSKSMNVNSTALKVGDAITEPSERSADTSESNANKIGVLETLKQQNGVMTIREVVDSMKRAYPGITDRATTYAISAVKQTGLIKPFMPPGKRRGGYLGLADWFDESGILKDEYIAQKNH